MVVMAGLGKAAMAAAPAVGSAALTAGTTTGAQKLFGPEAAKLPGFTPPARLRQGRSRDDQRRKISRARGRGSTILTDPLSLSEPNIGRATLSGAKALVGQ